MAEPLTGLVDTGFIAQLGMTELAALGVATTALSSVFWIFNFLSIGAQTGVAQSLGKQRHDEAVKITSLALMMAAVLSGVMMILGFLTAPLVAQLLGAEGAVLTNATVYINIRLIGAPAILFTLVGFGVLRGMQDMKTPMLIAVVINVLNIVLDAPLIFGYGVIPMMGVAGAALATVISQWIGALWILYAIGKRLGFSRNFHFSDALDLIQIGRDLFMRSGLLILFLILATRVANQISVDAGAAHQIIRQIWYFTAFVMEAFAMTAQSLVGYFIGSERVETARKAATYSMWWSLGTGIVLAIAMLAGTNGVIQLFLPEVDRSLFIPAWIVAALAQPLNSLAFVTDGIHWGTSDYRYLRNGMITATLAGGIALFLINIGDNNAFVMVWVATGLWIIVRSIFGMIRIWPGFGTSPLRL
ncbi:MAG: MATE family efflux transporter [Anaerolineae bacterium]|nr:MATE family efflux transporter [Anaerolineae bacterium]